MHFSKTFALAMALAVVDIAYAIPQNRNFGNNNNNNANSNTGNNNAAAASQALLAANLQSASASNGNPNTTAGQSASLTDKANFINFCSGKTITNGQQITTGSCNGIVMGDMPSQNNMVSSIIINPGPGDNIAANTDFKIQVQVSNLDAGIFTNPQDSYYAAPQQLTSAGNIIGHTHVVVQNLGNSLSPKTPPDAKTFTFFKGIDDDGNGNGLLSATVTGGLPAGNYRVCSMSSSSNHQPVLMPVAQRGAQDDCQKFTVSDNGNTNANTGTGTNANGNQSGKASVNSGQNGNSNTNNNGGNNGNTGSQTTSSSNSQSTGTRGTKCNGGQNSNTQANNGAGSGTGNTNANGNANNSNSNNNRNGSNSNSNTDSNGNSQTTGNTNSQSTNGSGTSCQNANNQNNNNNNDKQRAGAGTRTTTSNHSHGTGMMEDEISGISNGVVNEDRRRRVYQA